jgi:DNA-binding beta-propeller fold protein YncE
MVLLTGVAAAPAGAFIHPGHKRFAAPASSAARVLPFAARTASGPPSPARAPGLGAFGRRFGFGSALAGSAPTGNGPSLLAVNPATHTIYVSNGENNNGPSAGGDTVSVIDARHCNAHDVSRCTGPWPTITVGNGTPGDLPSGIAIDRKTDTVYVTNVGANTVSVFNGATCNAEDTSGCGQTPAEVPVGLGPLAISADPANHTLYVANVGNTSGASTTVSMIDSATCNATDLPACPTTARPTVDVGADPITVAVNQASHTVYVTTFSATHKARNGWVVFNASTCNATVQSGCGQIGRLIGNPAGPNDGRVDPANDTLYTADFTNTISAFDLRRCWAGDLAGCATDKPGIVTPFPEPDFGEQALNVAVDQSLHSVYVTYQKDALLVVVDSNVCNGRHLSACATLRPPTIHSGAFPQGVVLDSHTQTLYTANTVGNDISVIAAARCNAHTTSGCRHPAPAVTVPTMAAGILGTGAPTTDPAVHTAYVPSGAQEVSMIDTRACNTYHLAGCAHAPARATVGAFPAGIAADPGTHTVYVANDGSGTTGTVSVLNAATCNATDQAGCTNLPTLQVPGGNPDGIVTDPKTGTIYVTTIPRTGPDLISVFNAATCNASDTSGCGQKPALLRVGHSAKGISDLSAAVNDQTNTLYVTNVVYATQVAHTVYVFNAATCDATVHTGCGQAPETVTVGDDPRGLAIDPATDTIYVANHAAGDFPGTVSVINGAICNGTNHTGCGQTTATTAAGFGAVGIAVDSGTHKVYVTNDEDTSVSVINGTTCNGTDHTGCSQSPAEDAVGNYPNAVGVDISLGTAYVSNFDGTLSVIPLSH